MIFPFHSLVPLLPTVWVSPPPFFSLELVLFPSLLSEVQCRFAEFFSLITVFMPPSHKPPLHLSRRVYQPVFSVPCRTSSVCAEQINTQFDCWISVSHSPDVGCKFPGSKHRLHLPQIPVKGPFLSVTPLLLRPVVRGRPSSSHVLPLVDSLHDQN